MNVINDVCQQVVNILTQKYPESLFGFELDTDTDIYHVWYNQFSLTESDDFYKDVDDILEEKFYSLGIFNVFVAYFFKYDPSNRIVCTRNKPQISLDDSDYITISNILDNCLVINTGNQHTLLQNYMFNYASSQRVWSIEKVQLDMIRKPTSVEPIQFNIMRISDHADGCNGLLNLFASKSCTTVENNELATKECVNYFGVAA